MSRSLGLFWRQSSHTLLRFRQQQQLSIFILSSPSAISTGTLWSSRLQTTYTSSPRPHKMAQTSDVPRGPVTAKINYYVPPADGSKPYMNVEGTFYSNYSEEALDTHIEDVRGREADFNLDTDAFQVIRGVPESKEEDFVDDESLRANFYPEVEELLLKNIPGAHKVVIFDHTVRRSNPDSKRVPVLRAHIDQIPSSAERRVRVHVSPDEAEMLLQGRYRIINVWLPLNRKPLEASPLAFASSQSLENDDAITTELRNADGYSGYTAAIRHNPNQKWYYLSGMTRDERLLLECFDSEGLKEGSGVQGGRLAHTAIEDPRTRPDAEGRESIEVRTLVFGP